MQSFLYHRSEAVARRCSVKKCSQKCRKVHRKTPVSESLSSFLIKLQALAWNFIKKETPAQVFSCEFCEISESAFSYRMLLWLLLKGPSDFQTKGLEREREREKEREKDLKSTAADRRSITISYINAIRLKRPFYRCFG